MASIIDDTVAQALNTGFAKEAAGASDSRTRSWDELAKAIAVAQVVNLGNPTTLVGQGIRMLNGTPGQFANAVPAGP
jgi:hypothetical protein